MGNNPLLIMSKLPSATTGTFTAPLLLQTTNILIQDSDLTGLNNICCMDYYKRA